ncbi:transposon ty3-G gag-pol polyprotein [Tanacetum coccineum]
MTLAEFSKALLGTFEPTDYEDPTEALSRLKQVTTMAFYQDAFEKISHQVDGLPEVFLVGCFIGGFKEEIRLEVKLKKPRSLMDAIGMAHLVEEKSMYNVGFHPTTLPPKPFQDHGISLLPGAKPVSTRPYRQPYLQKAEIKKQTLDEQMDHLQVVLGILEANQLFAKASKCCFGITQVNYLGYVISSDGVVVESDKIQTVLSCPTPTNPKGVWGFLGLAGYYCKFIKGFGGIAAPLHRLVAKSPFQWDEYANQAFEDLKKALTTTPTSPTLGLPNWSLPFTLDYDAIQKEVRTTPYYSGLPSSLPSNSQKGVVLRDGVWFREGAILLSPTSPLLPTVLEMCHSSLEGGHFGFHKTLAKVKQSFWWVGLKERLKRFIRECSVCQRFKTDSMKPAGLLQPLPIPERVWEDVSMDFVEGLPNSNGFTAVMVVVDRLSKYAHFVPLRHPFTAATIAREFVSNPEVRDKVFISSFWQALFKLQGTGLCMSSSYHPQSDGQTEVVNRMMEQYLRCFVGDKPKKLVERLPWAEYSYNTSVHSSTKMTPFQVVYGRAPTKLIPYVPGTTNVQAVNEYLRYRDELLRQLRVNLVATQHPMKIQADHHRKDLEFEVVTDPIPAAIDVPQTPQPECIFDERVVQKGKYLPKTELLVKWVGCPREDVTWEMKWRFARFYPNFRLEDKAGVDIKNADWDLNGADWDFCNDDVALILLCGVRFGVRVRGVRVGGIRIGGVRVDGVRVRGVQVRGVQVDGVRDGGVRVGGVRVGVVRVGGVRVDGVRVGGVRFGGVRVSGVRVRDYDYALDVLIYLMADESDKNDDIKKKKLSFEKQETKQNTTLSMTLRQREFDENLLRRLSEYFYEDKITNLPSAPDVSNFLNVRGGYMGMITGIGDLDPVRWPNSHWQSIKVHQERLGLSVRFKCSIYSLLTSIILDVENEDLNCDLLQDKRHKDYYVAELYQFTSYGKIVDLEIVFSDHQNCLEVEGILFQPLVKVC